MRVSLIDPSADVLPYDHALAAALARRGVDVELATSRFVHGPAPAADGYEVSESFYRLATRLGARRSRLRRALKLAEHVPDSLRLRRRAAGSDLIHWQWMWLEALSLRTLSRERPQVMTMHNVIRRGRSGRRLADRMDAVIVHTRQGAELLGGGPRVHVIPHGAFEHLTRQPDERPLPPELAAVDKPVVLFFGVVRPYKGADVLVEAFRSISDAELWVVGRPLGVTLDAPANVRLVPRYVSDAELPAFFRRADLLVLPHRTVDVSGVLFAGLAFGKPMLLSDVGRLSRAGRGARRGPARCTRRPGRSLRRHPRAVERSRRARAARRARPRGGGRAVLLGHHRGTDRRGLRRGAGRMRAVFMGKNKRSAARALDWLVDQGVEVVAVVAREPDRFTRDEQRVDLVAERHGLPLVEDTELYAHPPQDVDVVISFLFWKLIREPLISLGRIGCLNFHPAPLPDFRGLGGYNVAVLEGLDEWGVSCHFVDEHFDTGALVGVERFAIDPATETAFSLDLKSQERLLGLFQSVMSRVLAGEELPRRPQGDGRYVSYEEFEQLKVIRPGDDVERKLRAFWYPPHPGALAEVAGRRLTLVDERILADVADAYRDAGRLP